MKTNKKAGNIRQVLIILVIILTLFSMVACADNDENTTNQEYELVSCYIENRNETNGFGGIMKIRNILHYGYIDENRKVIFDEQEIVSGLTEFEVAKENPKVIIKKDQGRIIYVYRLTKDMYMNINNSKQ